MKRVCVFCGSSKGHRPAYAEAARAMGRALARRGLGLVYGGGCIGLMGVVADAVMEAGGEAIGVIPEALLRKELGHQGLTELKVVRSMHERKAEMARLADGFVALPGGYGTFEEFCEVLTWAQLGIHDKPCGLLDVDGYWAPMLSLIDHSVGEGFVRPEHRLLVLSAPDPDLLLAHMAEYRPPVIRKWIEPGEA
jgi:uncharacterized protein (TIGR00730 family)